MPFGYKRQGELGALVISETCCPSHPVCVYGWLLCVVCVLLSVCPLIQYKYYMLSGGECQPLSFTLLTYLQPSPLKIA